MNGLIFRQISDVEDAQQVIYPRHAACAIHGSGTEVERYRNSPVMHPTTPEESWVVQLVEQPSAKQNGPIFGVKRGFNGLTNQLTIKNGGFNSG